MKSADQADFDSKDLKRQKAEKREDTFVRIFLGTLFSFFAAGIWFALTIGIWVNPNSSLLLKVPMISLFVIGLIVIEFFLIRAIIKSKQAFKFDRHPSTHKQRGVPGNTNFPHRSYSSDTINNPAFSNLRGNIYHR